MLWLYAYPPAPARSPPCTASPQELLVALVPREAHVASLPAATARACLPYWLEAGGWVVGLLSDATAAAMGRLPHREPSLRERRNSPLVRRGLR